MRSKDKVEKYLDRLVKKYNGKLVESSLSRYYTLFGRVIRVSNHYASNSSGKYSIIVNNINPDYYVVANTNNGRQIVLSYNQLKDYIKNEIYNYNLGVAETFSTENEEIVVDFLHQVLSENQIKQLRNWSNTLKNLL